MKIDLEILQSLNEVEIRTMASQVRAAAAVGAPREGVHRLAVVHDDCELGPGSRVWQFASVIRGAVIGADCNIASCAIVDGSQMGDGCLIGHGAQIHPGAVLGVGVFIGPGAILANDLWPHVSKDGFSVSGPTVRVDDGASIGAGAVILPGVHIGPEALVAANATVNRDVPAGMVVLRDGELIEKPADWRERRVKTAC